MELGVVGASAREGMAIGAECDGQAAAGRRQGHHRLHPFAWRQRRKKGSNRRQAANMQHLTATMQLGVMQQCQLALEGRLLLDVSLGSSDCSVDGPAAIAAADTATGRS